MLAHDNRFAGIAYYVAVIFVIIEITYPCNVTSSKGVYSMCVFKLILVASQGLKEMDDSSQTLRIPSGRRHTRPDLLEAWLTLTALIAIEMYRFQCFLTTTIKR